MPTLVKFKDVEENEMNYGILFNNQIICLECGGVIDLEDVIEYENLSDEWIDIQDILTFYGVE